MSKLFGMSKTVVSVIMLTPLAMASYTIVSKVSLLQDHDGVFDYQQQTTLTTSAVVQEPLPQKRVNAIPTKVATISSGYNVTRPAVVTAGQLNRHLQGVLRNKGQLIINQCYKQHVCPVFVTGVLIHESGNGSSALSKDRNNVAGIYDGKRKAYVKFDSVDQCIIKTISLLASKNYAGGRRKTVGDIQKYYCPVGAANDPKGINGHWLGGVIKWMKVVAEDDQTYYAIN